MVGAGRFAGVTMLGRDRFTGDLLRVGSYEERLLVWPSELRTKRPFLLSKWLCVR